MRPVAVKNSKYYIFCACVALVIQHEKCMHRIICITCGLSGYKIFFHIITQTARFSEKILLNIKCALIYNILLKTFPVVRRIQQDIIPNMKTSSHEVHVILVRF